MFGFLRGYPAQPSDGMPAIIAFWFIDDAICDQVEQGLDELNAELNNSNGENVRISLTKTKHIWSQARNKCSLIGNEHKNITVPTFDSDLMWTGDSARYLPWVEYLGCYGLKAGLVVDKIHVEPGKQLKECLLHCKQNDFIGLQQSNCVCLHYLKFTDDYLVKPCNTKGYPAKCQGDKTAFCGSGDPGYISDAFSIYQKVNVSERLDNGNCLAVERQIDSLYYVARNCSTEYFQICLNGGVHQQNMMNRTWIDSFDMCPAPSYRLSRYSLVYNKANFTRMGTYWLSNTRRWIQGTFKNPEVCIAARVKEDGHLERFPIRCDRKLPGLCASHEIPHHETNGNKMTSSDDQQPINKVLLISVIAATSLIILVAIVIVIFCIRMKRLQSNSSQNQIVVAGNNVVCAQVERPMNQDRTIDETTGQHTGEDTYDHMDHRCLNQRPPQEESNYDMMSNIAIVEENDYSHTNETDRERQYFIDASSEYSHVTVVAKPETTE
ncbi:unnamed protein product [Mytilus coruscus]|uniref:WSC domain-containing protein n=1 Tax=Mytilus coruscus TaxID=42192 RepID=A0A6J8BW90_MYTCO|nr:unnamed protein product [Mytilus coruscus]